MRRTGAHYQSVPTKPLSSETHGSGDTRKPNSSIFFEGKTAMSPYPATNQLVAALAAKGIKIVSVEPHSESFNDPEPDVVWLNRDEASATCEGDYLAIVPVGSGRPEFAVEHRSADRFGGHPTHWADWIYPGDANSMSAVLDKHFTDQKPNALSKHQTWTLVIIGSAIGVWLGLHHSPF